LVELWQGAKVICKQHNQTTIKLSSAILMARLWIEMAGGCLKKRRSWDDIEQCVEEQCVETIAYHYNYYHYD
jgi:aminopeptidase N